MAAAGAGRRAARAVLLDGGMGHQLKAMGVEIAGKVGSMERFLGVAMANTRDPALVRDAHLAYIDAGAPPLLMPRVCPRCCAGRAAVGG